MCKIVATEYCGDFELNIQTDSGSFLERLGVIYDKAQAERIARLLNDPLIALVAVEDIHKALVAQGMTC